jgi:hypothetical protein
MCQAPSSAGRVGAAVPDAARLQFLECGLRHLQDREP